MSAQTGLLQSFLAAIQASVSVLLVLGSGAVAARLKLIDRKDTKPVSKICARLFLPALLITKVGSELQGSSARNYLVIVVWGIAVHVVSFLVGLLGHRIFNMPDYVTPAILINNSTSYPLLLITALEETGILDSLAGADESTKEAIERAKSYLLVYSTISNCVTFAVGPRLIDSDDVPDVEEGEDEAANTDEHHGISTPDVEANEETRLLDSRLPNTPHPLRRSSFSFARARPDKKPPVQPDPRRPWFVPRHRWSRFSPRVKWWCLFILDFFNAPLVGAIIGAIVGLVPPFHRAFFSSTDDGGIFTAWLTSALKSIGGLFVSLPVVVAGVTLFCATKEARAQNESPIKMPLWTTLYILLVRFVAWPAISISSIYLLASKTGLVGSDPVLWFCLMLMPTGPSAMKLITLVQVADGTKESEKHISKLLTMSYVISPVLSLTVAGSLLASQTAMSR
ncbi:auxin efflux carrier [Corynascus similis CBS 632.67]